MATLKGQDSEIELNSDKSSHQNLAQIYAPIHIVNIIKNAFLRYRGLILAPPDLFQKRKKHRLTYYEIVNDMKIFGYIRIDALREIPRGKRDLVIFFILGSDSDYSHSGIPLRKLLDSVESEILVKEGRLDEIIIIASEYFFTKKNLTEEVEKYRSRNPKDLDKTGSKPFYNAYPYYVFSLVLPEHKAVFPHRLLSQTETMEILQKFYLKKRDLPVIYTNDPPIIWNGGREGQIVEILRDSPITGHAIGYRRIVQASRWVRNL